MNPTDTNTEHPTELSPLQRLCGCWKWGQIHHGRWGIFKMDQPLDVIRYRIFEWVEWCEDLPRSLRWSLANRLCVWAHRLYGGKAYDLGWGTIGNHAAWVTDELRWKFIPTPDHMSEDDAKECLELVAELGDRAHAIWFHNPTPNDTAPPASGLD